MTTSTLDLLTEHPFLADMPQQWLQRLSSASHPVVYEGGRRLFSERRPAQQFWLLRSGSVALDLYVAGRGEVVIEKLGADTVLGWSWLFPPYRWQFRSARHRADGGDRVRRRRRTPAGGRGRRAGSRADDQVMGVVVDRLQASRTQLMNLSGYPPANG